MEGASGCLPPALTWRPSMRPLPRSTWRQSVAAEGCGRRPARPDATGRGMRTCGVIHRGVAKCLLEGKAKTSRNRLSFESDAWTQDRSPRTCGGVQVHVANQVQGYGSGAASSRSGSRSPSVLSGKRQGSSWYPRCRLPEAAPRPLRRRLFLAPVSEMLRPALGECSLLGRQGRQEPTTRSASEQSASPRRVVARPTSRMRPGAESGRVSRANHAGLRPRTDKENAWRGS